MILRRFRFTSSSQEPDLHRPDRADVQGEYDFHAFCLEIMDVIWAWAFAGGVVLVLFFLS